LKEKKEGDGEDKAADKVSGRLESSARVFADRGPVLLDARMDASMAQTYVSDWSVPECTFTYDLVRPNTVLMFIFMEELQKLVDSRPRSQSKSDLLQQASKSSLRSRAL
jgi:hypothetical protein